MSKSVYTPSPINLDIKLGPAMSALNPRQRGFVIAFLAAGGKNARKAAIAAGYGGGQNDSSVDKQAYRLVHSEPIQAAIHEEVTKRQQAVAVRAQANLEKIADNPGAKNHFEANKLLLALAGHSPVNRSEHIVTHELSTADMVEKIRLLGAALGENVVKALLPPERVVIDITPEKE